MNAKSKVSQPAACVLATDLKAIGKIVRDMRRAWAFDLLYASELMGSSVEELSRLEDGESVGSAALCKVLHNCGLAMLVMPKDDAVVAMSAVGHTGTPPWMRDASQAGVRPASRLGSLVLDNATPTLFLDFDGTLHVGHAYLDEDGKVTLDSGRPLLEFAPILAELLELYPAVEIVLTTSWVRTLPLAEVAAYLPAALESRVVGSTHGIKPRLSHILSGTDRAYVISSYAFGKRMKNWLALDDAVGDAHRPGEMRRG